MKILYFVIVMCMIMSIGCKKNYNHKPGGPYYFKWNVSYKGFYPTGEITKDEVKILIEDGYAYTIAFFNNDGKPEIMKKYHKGEMVKKIELYYKDKKLSKVIIIDKEGNKTINNY